MIEKTGFRLSDGTMLINPCSIHFNVCVFNGMQAFDVPTV